MALTEGFDIGGDMEGTQGCELRHADLLARGEEAACGALIGPPGVDVADGGDEELDITFGGLGAGGGDRLRNDEAVGFEDGKGRETVSSPAMGYPSHSSMTRPNVCPGAVSG